MEDIDLVVAGSVAVSKNGERVGKGGGYSDLEYAILRDLGLVDDETPVATTIHERQGLSEELTLEAHDVPMDLVVTPKRVIRPKPREKPAGIDWELLDEERLEEIPVLERLHERT